MKKLGSKDRKVVVSEESEALVAQDNKVCIKEKKFYEKPWFWICITIIVMCITRPNVICGNNNGNGGNNNGNGSNNKGKDI